MNVSFHAVQDRIRRGKPSMIQCSTVQLRYSITTLLFTVQRSVRCCRRDTVASEIFRIFHPHKSHYVWRVCYCYVQYHFICLAIVNPRLIYSMLLYWRIGTDHQRQQEDTPKRNRRKSSSKFSLECVRFASRYFQSYRTRNPRKSV